MTDAVKAAGVRLIAKEMTRLETLAKEEKVDTRGSRENPMA